MHSPLRTTGTHLLVDETALTPGQLTEVGVKNLTALGNLIQWQKVTYDFQYHTSEFECNLVSGFVVLLCMHSVQVAFSSIVARYVMHKQ